ncbi:unnamed protein product, partial [Iphiclides podalirius]
MKKLSTQNPMMENLAASPSRVHWILVKEDTEVAEDTAMAARVEAMVGALDTVVPLVTVRVEVLEVVEALASVEVKEALAALEVDPDLEDSEELEMDLEVAAHWVDTLEAGDPAEIMVEALAAAVEALGELEVVSEEELDLVGGVDLEAELDLVVAPAQGRVTEDSVALGEVQEEKAQALDLVVALDSEEVVESEVVADSEEALVRVQAMEVQVVLVVHLEAALKEDSEEAEALDLVVVLDSEEVVDLEAVMDLEEAMVRVQATEVQAVPPEDSEEVLDLVAVEA